MIELDWKRDERKLRHFSWIGLGGFAAMGLLAWLRAGNLFAAGVLWTLGGAVFFLGQTAPRRLKPLFVFLSLITLPIGFVISYIVLGVIYFAVFTSFSLAFRLFK